MIRNISRFIAALALLATAQGAWADTETVSYIDADGNAQTVTATVLTGNEEPSKWGTIDLSAGWYVVKGNISYTNEISYGSSIGTIHIILADGAQMSVDKNGDDAIFLSHPLAIYGQSAGTGRLSVTSDRIAIYATGGITINGGIVSATSTGDDWPAINAYNGAITINGGQVTATPGDNAKGISTKGTITLGLRSTSDFITANGYYGTVNIKDGQALKDPSGNIYYGTLTDAQKSAIANVTLQPATQVEFIAAALPQTAADTYTISDAAGWNVFCDLLADNTKGYFSGKTVQLDADITVTRMAGGDSHDFTGTFDGDGHTLTFSHTATDNYCAPFRHVQGASAETPAVIRNLNVVSTVTAADYRHPAGLIALQSGYVSVTNCNVEAHISNTVGTANPTNLYPAALVSQSNNTGVLTVSGCTTSGEIATDGKYAAGLIGIVQNTATIENCRVSVTIQSSTSGDGTHGGLVASQSSGTTITITGCLFDGRLLGSATSSCGGFIGWRGNTATIYNSLFAPAEVTVQNSGSATFARNTVDTYNCYYTTLLNDGTIHVPALADGTVSPAKWHNGKATRTVAAADDVTIKAVALTGTATQYTVSGITAYSGGGLQRGQTLYYGIDDQLRLTLSNSATGAPLGYRYDGYTASAGTLSGTTLTMPDQDVTISVNTAALAPIDWATVNQGKLADPYMIYNKDQLLLLAHRVNGTNGETAVENGYKGKYFKLGADITFTHPDNEGDNYAENYEAIGGYIGSTERYFKGNFDGDGHTVSGIRLRKTGSDLDDYCQGLFGQTGIGAIIHDVHLTDARITGPCYVGGIVGYIGTSTLSGCIVTDSYITASEGYGTICGSSGHTEYLTNNYYHGCAVNGTAVTSGMGCKGADNTDNNGALPAYRLDLGANITTPPGTFAGQTEWLDTPPDGARLAPENGFTLAGNHYFASGYVFTPGSTLASGAAQGYTPRATLGDELLPLYTHMDDAPDYTGTAIARLTITAVCDGKTLSAALRSDGLEHEVSYIKADGTTQTAQAIALDGHEAVDSRGYVSLAAGTYYVGTDITYANPISLNGNVTLILCDGCEMKVGTSEARISGYGIRGYSYTLDIYAQSLGDDMGALSIYTSGSNKHGIYVNALTVNGGNITADTKGSGATAIEAAKSSLTINGGNVTATSANSVAIHSVDKIYINGGTVNATGDAQGISGSSLVEINGGTVNATCTGSGYGIRASGSLAINGGNVTASSFYAGNGTITLGWTRPADRITASSISAPYGTVAVKEGQALTDGSGNIYTVTLTADDLAALGGKTLQPCLVLNETDGVTPLAAFAGQANVPVIFTRTFTIGVASTVCLPFAISADQATAAGKFYTFAGVDTSDTEWVVTMQQANAANAALAANTPYLFMPSADSEVTFSGTIGNVADTYTAGTTTSDGWTYQGTYATLEWKTDPSNIYGFASGQAYGNTGDQTEAGKFIRVHTGGIRPFRAYLKYAPSANSARALSRSANDGLPETMTVRLIGSNGQTTAIGTLDTRTGDVTFGDEWYTLDGRRLPAKPTAKGLYINKGNKVFIK